MKSFSYVVRMGENDPPRDDLTLWLRSLAPGTRLEVSYKVIRDVRSLGQNRRYFGLIVPCVAEVLSQSLAQDAMPVSKDEAHERLKEHFIGFIETELGRIPKRSKDLSVPEFKAYCDRIEEWLIVKFGIVVPSREDDYDA